MVPIGPPRFGARAGYVHHFREVFDLRQPLKFYTENWRTICFCSGALSQIFVFVRFVSARRGKTHIDRRTGKTRNAAYRTAAVRPAGSETTLTFSSGSKCLH